MEEVAEFKVNRRAIRRALKALGPESIQFRDEGAGQLMGIGVEWPGGRRHAILFDPATPTPKMVAEFKHWLEAPPPDWLAEQFPDTNPTAAYGLWIYSQPTAFARYMMTREEFCARWPWEDPDEYGLPIIS